MGRLAGALHAETNKDHGVQRLGLDVLQQLTLHPDPRRLLGLHRGLGSRKSQSQLVGSHHMNFVLAI